MVNINDVNQFEPEIQEEVQGDRLEAIFRRQRKLMDKYEQIERENGFYVPVGSANLNERKDQHYLKDLAWRITEELGEAMNCLKNKPWKQTHHETDEAHYREELIDGFHFYVELLILSGIDAEKLFMTYFQKSRVNQFRQRSGY